MLLVLSLGMEKGSAKNSFFHRPPRWMCAGIVLRDSRMVRFQPAGRH